MDPIGLPIQSSVAGAGQAERQTIEKRANKDREAKRFRRVLDQAEFGDGLDPTDTIDAVRSVKGNNQEESREDRQEHDLQPGADQSSSLDVEG